MLEIIQESWVYQETLQKGIEQGLKKGLEKGLEKGREEGLEQGLEQGLEKGRQQGALQTAQHMAISIVAARFPELEQLAKLIIASISDLKRLEVLVIELSTSLSQEHTKELLLSLVSAA